MASYGCCSATPPWDSSAPSASCPLPRWAGLQAHERNGTACVLSGISAPCLAREQLAVGVAFGDAQMSTGMPIKVGCKPLQE